jgi:hypothetical protein
MTVASAKSTLDTEEIERIVERRLESIFNDSTYKEKLESELQRLIQVKQRHTVETMGPLSSCAISSSTEQTTEQQQKVAAMMSSTLAVVAAMSMAAAASATAPCSNSLPQVNSNEET